MDFLRINSRDEPLGIGDGAGRFQEPGGRWQGNRVSLRVTSAAEAESVSVLLIRGGQLDDAGRNAGGARIRSSC